MYPALLSKDWLLHPSIDRELKHYTLLAYLQRVHQRFAERKLYPHLQDLADHLKDLIDLRRRADELRAGLHRDITQLDARTGKVSYTPPPATEGVMGVIEEVIGDALPALREGLDEGIGLRDRISGHLQFGPVGVMPLDPRAGYLLLRQDREARIYTFCITLLRDAQHNLHWRSVVTHYLGSRALGLHCTYEAIRADLIARRPEMPVPATFCLECDWEVPHIETLLPLGKQLVHRYVTGEHRTDGVTA